MPIISSPYAIYQHSTTSKTIVKAALRKIGALAAGEEPRAGELQDAFDEMNRMLDNWNTESLTVNVLNKTEYTVSSGTSSLEIGSGAALDQVRPLKITQGDAYIKDGNNEYELQVYDKDFWARIIDKTVTGRPSILYYEDAFPIAKLNFWPVMDKGYNLILYTWNLLGQVSNVEQQLALPPGYADAITLQLALRLAPEYGKSAPPEVVAGAVEAKANIKRLNNETPILQCDDALVYRHGYNRLDEWFR